jgi:quercetin dioxygenase-like cupin family protein
MVGVLVALALLPAVVAWGQLAGARWWAIPLSEDPGVSWMLVAETPDYRVLRDFATPGATRRMHHHSGTTWHVLTVATGKVRLMVEGSTPVDLAAGQSTTLKGGANHTFTSIGTETATLVEVFGKVVPTH